MNEERLTGEETGAEKPAAVPNLIRKSDCTEGRGVNLLVNEGLVLQHSRDEMSSESGRDRRTKSEKRACAKLQPHTNLHLVRGDA